MGVVLKIPTRSGLVRGGENNYLKRTEPLPKKAP